MIDATLCTRAKYTNLPRVRSAIGAAPFDAVVVSSPENVSYYSGFYNHDIRIFPERAHFILWSKHAGPIFIVYQKRGRMLDSSATFINDIRMYEGEGTDSMRILAEALTQHGLNRGLLGIEERFMPAGHLIALKKHLPELRTADAYPFMERLRGVKTPAEVAMVTHVARLTTDAIDTVFASATVGDTERELSARIQYEILRRGADVIGAAFFSSGDRTGALHPYAIDRPIPEGTLIKVDCGGQVDGYYSDIGRMAVMGCSSAEQRDLYARLTEIKDRIAAFIKPGLTGGEIARYGRAQYADLGLQMKWGMLGHSIGLMEHEEPQLYPDNKSMVEEGMTMMVEVGYTDPPRDSFILEDLIVVEAGGARYLTDVGKCRTLPELGR